jgi:hypothetical protein
MENDRIRANVDNARLGLVDYVWPEADLPEKLETLWGSSMSVCSSTRRQQGNFYTSPAIPFL